MPYDKTEAPLNTIGCMPGIKSGGMNFVHALTNFNNTRYRKHPEIQGNTIRFLTPMQLNVKFSKPKSPVAYPHSVWEKLIMSIPESWKNIILEGNQKLSNDEFFAIPTRELTFSDVYKYKDGLLYYYNSANDNNKYTVEYAGESGHPGQITHNNITGL